MSLKGRETHEVSATIVLAFCPEMLLELWLGEAEPRRRPRSICLRGKKQSLNCQGSWNFSGQATGEQYAEQGLRIAEKVSLKSLTIY